MYGKKIALPVVVGLVLSAAIAIPNGNPSSSELETPSRDMNLGTTLYVGGSGPNNYTHIQDAIDNASDGDTVFVYDDSSPYCENIIINKSIDLIGENKDTTIINGSYGGDVIKITVDSVSITRFTIRNSTFGGAGIDIHSSYNNISDNNIISNHNGIKLHYSSNNIFGNTISSNYLEGILLDYSSSNNSICSNKISDNDKGIWLYYSSNNSICSNKISDNDQSIYFTCSSNNNVSNNKILNNGGGIWLVSSSNNSIFSNNISSNKWEGISLWYSSNNNSISSNNILNNHRGVEIIYNSNFNVIKYNNFIKNDIQAIFKYTPEIPHLRPFSNHWNRNYWDNWPGLIPKPVFGLIEVEAHPRKAFPWFNFDWHPAEEPYERWSE